MDLICSGMKTSRIGGWDVMYSSLDRKDFTAWVDNKDRGEYTALLILKGTSGDLDLVQKVRNNCGIAIVYAPEVSPLFQEQCLQAGAVECYRENFNEAVFGYRLERILCSSGSGALTFLRTLEEMIGEQDFDERGGTMGKRVEVLSPLQKEILLLVGKGYSNLEISKRVDKKPGTIANQLTCIRMALDISLREDLALIGRRFLQ